MKYKINKGFIQEKLENKTVIFDNNKSVLHTFNETASFIFQQLKKEKDEKNIIDMIVNRFKIERDVAEKDLKELIYEFKKKRIIIPKKESQNK